MIRLRIDWKLRVIIKAGVFVRIPVKTGISSRQDFVSVKISCQARNDKIIGTLR